MSLHKRLLKICDLLDAGVNARSEIVKCLQYSEQQAQKTPNQANPESLTVCTDGKKFPTQSKLSVSLSRRLSGLAREFSSGSDAQTIATNAAESFRKLVELWGGQAEFPSKKQSSYYHPIFAVNDELREKPSEREKWKRPAVAAEYIRRMSGGERKQQTQQCGGHDELLKKCVHVLRNHKNKLRYP